MNFFNLIASMIRNLRRRKRNKSSEGNSAVLKSADEVTFYRSGIQKFRSAEYIGAIDDFSKAISIRKNFHQAFCNRGLTKLKINDNSGASLDFSMAIEIHPVYAKAYFNRGIAKKKLADPVGSKEDFIQAVKIEPKYTSFFAKKTAPNELTLESQKDNSGSLQSQTPVGLIPGFPETSSEDGSENRSFKLAEDETDEFGFMKPTVKETEEASFSSFPAAAQQDNSEPGEAETKGAIIQEPDSEIANMEKLFNIDPIQEEAGNLFNTESADEEAGNIFNLDPLSEVEGSLFKIDPFTEETKDDDLYKTLDLSIEAKDEADDILAPAPIENETDVDIFNKYNTAFDELLTPETDQPELKGFDVKNEEDENITSQYEIKPFDIEDIDTKENFADRFEIKNDDDEITSERHEANSAFIDKTSDEENLLDDLRKYNFTESEDDDEDIYKLSPNEDHEEESELKKWELNKNNLPLQDPGDWEIQESYKARDEAEAEESIEVNLKGLNQNIIVDLPEQSEIPKVIAQLTPENQIDFAKGYYYRAKLKYKSGDLQAAIEDFSGAIEFYPKFSQAFCQRGKIKAELNETEEAINDLSKAIQYNQKNSTAYFQRGLIRQKSGQSREAMADFTKAILFQPKNPQLYLYRGILKYKMGQSRSAFEDWGKAELYGLSQAAMLIEKYSPKPKKK